MSHYWFINSINSMTAGFCGGRIKAPQGSPLSYFQQLGSQGVGRGWNPQSREASQLTPLKRPGVSWKQSRGLIPPSAVSSSPLSWSARVEYLVFRTPSLPLPVQDSKV